MKLSLKSTMTGRLALGGACLLFAVFTNAAPPDKSMNPQSPLDTRGVERVWHGDSDDDADGDRHWGRDVGFVVGSAYTAMDEPHVSWYLKRVYTVVKTWRGVRGRIYVDYHEEYPDGGVFETTYVIRADCLEVDEDTREAWIGGKVVWADGPFPAPGERLVENADDSDGGNPLNPDDQGPSYWGPPDFYPYESDCGSRLPPLDWSYAESQRGKIVVR